MTVTAKVTGSIIAIRSESGAVGTFNRDKLATAYVLLLDNRDNVRGVVDALTAEQGMDHTEATRYTIAAHYCIKYDIEP